MALPGSFHAAESTTDGSISDSVSRLDDAATAGDGRSSVETVKDEIAQTGDDAQAPTTADQTLEGKPADEASGTAWACAICPDEAREAVVTRCGHLFDWSCLYEWFEAQKPTRCPVCQSACSQDTVVPIYAHGRKEVDPRSKPMPRRPQAERTAPVRPARGGFQVYGGVFPLGFGFGTSYLALVAYTAAFGGDGPELVPPGQQQANQWRMLLVQIAFIFVITIFSTFVSG